MCQGCKDAGFYRSMKWKQDTVSARGAKATGGQQQGKEGQGKVGSRAASDRLAVAGALLLGGAEAAKAHEAGHVGVNLLLVLLLTVRPCPPPLARSLLLLLLLLLGRQLLKPCSEGVKAEVAELEAQRFLSCSISPQTGETNSLADVWLAHHLAPGLRRWVPPP
jgi:hypothetical protein